MVLYFENRYGDRREIARCKNSKEVHTAIDAFIRTCNKGKPEDKKFKVHYTRTWTDFDEQFKENVTWYDVGSHSEFFLLKGVLNDNAGGSKN